MTQGPHFTLYSRSYCHLCEDMLAALRAFMGHAGVPYSVDVVDVDADPQLTDRFDELVPVLYGSPAATATATATAAAATATATAASTAASAAAATAGATDPGAQEICHYFLDELALQHYLATLPAA